MRVFYSAVVILYLSNHLARCSVDDDFVDPLDMLNYDRATKSMKRPKVMSDGEPMQINDRCTAFLSRFINVLIKTTGLDDFNHVPNGNSKEELKSVASVTISVEDLHVLKTMIKKQDINYEEIDRILKFMFTNLKDEIPEFQGTNAFSGMNVETKEILYWISIGCISIVLLYTVFHYFMYWFSMSFIIFVAFALAFASTWYNMYMKAEISRSVHLEFMPTHCHTNTKQHWYSWFSNVQDLDECKRYKEAIHLNPKYSIAITEVLAEMFSKMMMKPLECMGEAIYVFNKSVFKDYPAWIKLLMIPIVIGIIIKAMLMSCALLVGRHISMTSMFGRGSTTIGPEQTHADRLITNNRTHNSSCPTGENTVSQMPEIPKVNFNINVFHPSASSIPTNNKNKNSSSDNQFKINNKKTEFNFLSMLKNVDNDSVDNKFSDDRRVNQLRPRTLSI